MNHRERARTTGREQNEESQARAVRPLSLGAASLAPPRFRLHLPSSSFSKRGVPPLRPPHAVHPPIGSELPRPFPLHQLRRNRRENPTGFVGAFLSLAFFMPAFSDHFQRGKGRSVVRGGWRSQAGVVAKMVVDVVMVIVAWLVLWRSWWWRLLAWRFVAMVLQNNDR